MNKVLKILVLGPSGSGKTFVQSTIAEKYDYHDIKCYDLDWFGYRLKIDEDKTKWLIPPSIFETLNETAKDPELGAILAVGCDSDLDRMVKAARAHNFVLYFIIPSVSSLAKQRRKRGDSDEKIEEVEKSVRNWTNLHQQHAQSNRGDMLFKSSDEVIKYLTPIADELAARESMPIHEPNL